MKGAIVRNLIFIFALFELGVGIIRWVNQGYSSALFDFFIFAVLVSMWWFTKSVKTGRTYGYINGLTSPLTKKMDIIYYTTENNQCLFPGDLIKIDGFDPNNTEKNSIVGEIILVKASNLKNCALIERDVCKGIPCSISNKDIISKFDWETAKNGGNMESLPNYDKWKTAEPEGIDISGAREKHSIGEYLGEVEGSNEYVDNLNDMVEIVENWGCKEAESAFRRIEARYEDWLVKIVIAKSNSHLDREE